jgi:uncharacterized protein (TIGR03086 family)
MTTREILATAIGYALQGVALVTTANLGRPTPCAGWDVQQLVVHLTSSLAAIDEALSRGRLSPPGHDPDPGLPCCDPVEALRDQAAALLVTTFMSDWDSADIAGIRVPAALIRGTGALEAAVHGWDIYIACGQCRPVPPGIARPLLGALDTLIPSRDGLFAEPVPVPDRACPGDHLVAALGRDLTRAGASAELVTGE